VSRDLFQFTRNTHSCVDDEWADDGALEAPKYLFAAIVVKDYIPPTYKHLTLELDNLVYVFKTVLD